MKFGLSQQDLDEIVATFQRFPTVKEVVIFGSRAKGNYKNGSDIDIAVKGEAITHDDVAALSFALNEESAMPYFFDIVHFDEISEIELVEHIKRVGQTIHSRI